MAGRDESAGRRVRRLRPGVVDDAARRRAGIALPAAL